MPTNIRLGWKSKEVANTLAYYDMSTIIEKKIDNRVPRVLKFCHQVVVDVDGVGEDDGLVAGAGMDFRSRRAFRIKGQTLPMDARLKKRCIIVYIY